MAGFLSAMKAGLSAAIRANGPSRYQVEGRVIVCPICGHDRFAKGRAQLHTSGMTLMDLEWLQDEATTLACASCSRLEWFLDAPEEVG